MISNELTVKAMAANTARLTRGEITPDVWLAGVWRILAARYGDELLDQADITRQRMLVVRRRRARA